MKKLVGLLQYFFLWQQKILLLVVAIGMLLVMFGLVIAFQNDRAALVSNLAGICFLLAIPYCSGATGLRTIIANPQLAMVPGLRFHAGLAHLLLALATSFLAYLAIMVFGEGPFRGWFFFHIFNFLSLYAFAMQLILPSRYFVPVISFAPLVLVMLSINFSMQLKALLASPAFVLGLFVACLLVWAWGLNLLRTHRTFRPVNASLNDTEAWASYDGGLLTNMAIGQPRTAAGTLLLGYPDNRAGIIMRVLYYYLITPLFTSGAMLAIGITEKWDAPVWDVVFSLFLMVSLFSAVFCIFIYGELVARARLVWLRYGTDRLQQWRLVDGYCKQYLLVYYLCGVGVVLLTGLLTTIPAIRLVHYLMILFSFCLFNLYFSLLVRVLRLSPVVLALVVVVSVGILIGGVVQALLGNYTFLLTVEVAMLVLGLTFRTIVQNSFAGIDWKLVSIKKKGRYVLTQD